jgi:preprotein translocase subunit SecD
VDVVCARLRALGLLGVDVHPLGKRQLRVVLPRLRHAEARRVANQLEVGGELDLYDWEAELIGPERTIGGHPGQAPKASAVSRAEREWRAAGRTVKSPNTQLIRAGAFPTARRAAKLGSARGQLDTVIVSERPTNNRGEIIATSAPGWYVLRDNPALTGADIVDPNEQTGEYGEPAVTFGFTGKGRAAFEQVTRAIAHRGRAAARGHVTAV